MSATRKPKTAQLPDSELPQFDDVLLRMLNTPPQPRVKPKPKQSKKKAR